MTVPTVQTQSPDRPVAWKRMVLDQRSRLFWLALTLVGVGWALAFARDTKYSAHQIWGSLAVVGYGLAALAAMTLPRRWVPASVTSISIVGAVLAPLAVLTVSGHAQSEVGVVERSAQLLMSNGAVYLPDPHQRIDGLWAVVSLEVYELLVDRTGWSAARYERWLADTIVRLVRPGRGRS